VKFTPRGGSVSIIARRLHKVDYNHDPATKGPSDSIEISLRDTGIGINRSDLAHVFDQFEQVGNPISKKYEGTGLGLSLAKKLVELHQGKIWLKAKEEEKEVASVLPFPYGHKHWKLITPFISTTVTDRNIRLCILQKHP
jgi:signal transduction histidine kinase